MRARHRTATRKGLFAAAGVVAVGGLVAVLLPQATAEQRVADSGPSAMETLTSLRQERIPGTAWAVDPRSGRMVITADASVSGDTWNALKGTVRAVGIATLVFGPFQSMCFTPIEPVLGALHARLVTAPAR